MSQKIAFVLPSLAHGGAQKVFVELVDYLAEEGQPAELIVLERDGELVGQIPAHCRITYLNQERQGSAHIFSWLISAMRLKRLVKTRNIDVIYSTVTGMNIMVLILFYFRQHLKVVVREASSLENVRKAFHLKLIQFFFPSADHVICTSEHLLGQLNQLTKNRAKVSVIPNPIDMSRIRSLASHTIESRAVGSGAKIVAVGRLIEAKGFDVLIRAFAELVQHSGKAAFSEACLIVIGDGPERIQLEKLAADLGIKKQVQFMGYLENPYAIMRQCDLYVLSSRWEGYVNTVIEAMVLGLNIVATDCKSEPGELLRKHYGKPLVEVDDPGALARAISLEFDQPAPDYAPLLIRHSMAHASLQYLECVGVR